MAREEKKKKKKTGRVSEMTQRRKAQGRSRRVRKATLRSLS